METNKLILACLITLCSLPVAAQVKLGIEAGANLSVVILTQFQISTLSDKKKSRHQHQVILKLIVDCQACLKTYFHVFLSEGFE